MIRFLTKRAGDGLMTLAALVTLTFFVMRLAPGGPFSSNRKISPDILANVQASYHLDDPLVVQFLHYVWGVVRFDFGPSIRFRDYTVSEILLSGLPYSLTIGFWAVVVATVVGVTLGILGALRRNSLIDYSAGVVAVIGIAVPIFVSRR